MNHKTEKYDSFSYDDGGELSFFTVIVDAKGSNLKILKVPEPISGPQDEQEEQEERDEPQQKQPDNFENPFDEDDSDDSQDGDEGDDDFGDEGDDGDGDEGDGDEGDGDEDDGDEGDGDEGDSDEGDSDDGDGDDGDGDDGDGDDGDGKKGDKGKSPGFKDEGDFSRDAQPDEDEESIVDKIKRMRAEQEEMKKTLDRNAKNDLEAVEQVLGVKVSSLPSKRAAQSLASNLQLFDTMNSIRILNAVNSAFP
jgi:hypothetical protein